jgi:bifunctional DNase/RNase
MKNKDIEIKVTKFECGYFDLFDRNIICLFVEDGRKTQLITNDMTVHFLEKMTKMDLNMPVFVYEVAGAIIDMMGGTVEKAVIYHREEDDTNRGRIYIINDEADKCSFETVPDNAIALTFLTGAPLYVSDKLLSTKQESIFSEKSASLLPKDDSKLMELLRQRQAKELQSISSGDLQLLINKALNLEDYQMANILKTIIENKGGMPS